MAGGRRRDSWRSTAALVSTCAAALWLPASGKVVVKTSAVYESQRKGVLALCGIDVTQSVISLGQAGTGITGAIIACHPSEGEPTDKVVCAASVLGVFSSFMDIASFIASAAADCAEGLHVKEYCVADITGLAGSLSNLAMGALSLSRSCVRPDNGTETDEEVAVLSTAVGRRLGGLRPPRPSWSWPPRSPSGTANSTTSTTSTTSTNSTTTTTSIAAGTTTGQESNDVLSQLIKRRSEQELRALDLADCFFDVNSATSFLARSILALDAAADSSCEWQGPESTSVACVVDAFGVIGSFADVAAFISFAVTHCPIGENIDAVCAGDIANVISGIAGIVSAASSFKLTCGGQNTSLPQDQQDQQDMLVPLFR